jgi:hypothetical protein
MKAVLIITILAIIALAGAATPPNINKQFTCDMTTTSVHSANHSFTWMGKYWSDDLSFRERRSGIGKDINQTFNSTELNLKMDSYVIQYFPNGTEADCFHQNFPYFFLFGDLANSTLSSTSAGIQIWKSNNHPGLFFFVNVTANVVVQLNSTFGDSATVSHFTNYIIGTPNPAIFTPPSQCIHHAITKPQRMFVF